MLSQYNTFADAESMLVINIIPQVVKIFLCYKTIAMGPNINDCTAGTCKSEDWVVDAETLIYRPALYLGSICSERERFLDVSK